MRERCPPFALEDGEFGVEGPREPAVQLRDTLGREGCAFGDGRLDRGGDELQLVREAPQHLVGEEQIDVVLDGVRVGLRVQPLSRPRVLRGEPARDFLGDEGTGCVELVVEEHTAEAGARLGEHRADVVGEGARGAQPRGGRFIRGVGVVVEQQHHPHRRILLQRRREQRHLHHGRLLGVRRDEHGDRRLVRGEVPVEFGAGNADVLLEPLQRPLAGDEVHQRREGEERDHDQVADGLRRETEALRSAVEELPDDRGHHVDRPERDGQNDGDAAPGDFTVGGSRVDGGEGFGAALGAPLAFSGRGKRRCRTHFGMRP